ncbi:MAG: hypothetical protein GY772_09585 [bacterium]|nr:hypothetical protein [bacterium]
MGGHVTKLNQHANAKGRVPLVSHDVLSAADSRKPSPSEEKDVLEEVTAPNLTQK